MNRTAAVITLLVLALARTAAADDDKARAAAVKALLAAQGKALVADDTAAFKATLTADAVAMLGLDAPTTDVRVGGTDDVSKVTIVSSKVGWAGTWGWVAADLQIKSVLIAAAIEAGAKPETRTYHLVELLVPDGTGIKAQAVALMPTQADKDLVAYNYAQDELVPMASPSPLVAALARPTQLANDPGTSVFGTSPKDRGLGGPAAKKLVGGWAKVGLEVVDTTDAHEKDSYRPFERAFGDASVVWAQMRMKLPKKDRWIPIKGFAIGRKVNGTWELVALAYSAD